jgi:hypothetical protein
MAVVEMESTEPIVGATTATTLGSGTTVAPGGERRGTG